MEFVGQADAPYSQPAPMTLSSGSGRGDGGALRRLPAWSNLVHDNARLVAFGKPFYGCVSRAGAVSVTRRFGQEKEMFFSFRHIRAAVQPAPLRFNARYSVVTGYCTASGPRRGRRRRQSSGTHSTGCGFLRRSDSAESCENVGFCAGWRPPAIRGGKINCSTARGSISFNIHDGGLLFYVPIRNENVSGPVHVITE